MAKHIKKIVILGGGSAGWMSAATMIRFFPEREVVLIESPDVPIVGVGESTLGGIRNWTHALGIDEKDFMAYTNASYKLSIKFTDFYEKDAGAFQYPFGNPVLTDAPEGINEWQAKKIIYPDTPVDDYCRTYYSQIPLIEDNKYSQNKDGDIDGFREDTDVAYHFDAMLFGQWLKNNYCLPRGVKLITDTVTEVTTNEDGIEKLVLKSGDIVTSDLFIDCTGWKSMLLGDSLKEPFTSYADQLPNNRAWAVQLPYTDRSKELEPYTNCTAIGHGWVWNIPLWGRIGTGYVYSDKFITPEDALQEFKDHLNSEKMTVHNPNRVTDDLVFRDIKMRIGIHERTWVKNVVAIGLSAGFIEPLESNGLFTVHEFLMLLVSALDRPHINQWDRDGYNMASGDLFVNMKDFVALHYALSARDDTNYWQAISKKTFDPGMPKREPTLNASFSGLARSKYFNFVHPIPGGIHCIATGMNYFVMNRLNLIHAIHVRGLDPKRHVDEFVFRRKFLQDKWQRAADRSPTLEEYLKGYVHGNN
jgi:tryptophan halogenase